MAFFFDLSDVASELACSLYRIRHRAHTEFLFNFVVPTERIAALKNVTEFSQRGPGKSEPFTNLSLAVLSLSSFFMNLPPKPKDKAARSPYILGYSLTRDSQSARYLVIRPA